VRGCGIGLPIYLKYGFCSMFQISSLINLQKADINIQESIL